jgi:CRP-like cAMP-binding protein
MINTKDLKKQLLFSELDDAELERIARKLGVESYAKGAPVFTEGAPTRGICLVNTGKVEISKITPDGWKQTLAVLGEGQFFGELSLVEGKRNHSTNATAIDATELYRIRSEDFEALERSEQALMYKIMRTVARMASRNVHTMNDRLMKALISY